MKFTILFYCTYFIAVIIILCLSYEPKTKIDKEKHSRLGWLSITLLLLACGSILFSFYAPFLFTEREISIKLPFDTTTGAVGDTVGGLMNPFITIAGVIVTGLAFFMQYRANQLQIRFFNKGQKDSIEQFQYQLNQQQFESQFYEMLRLHKENVNEMELAGKKYEVNYWVEIFYSKRQVFHQMQLELESLIRMCAIDLLPENAKPPFEGKPLSQNQYNDCYKIFYFGYDESEKYCLPHKTIKRIKNIVIDRFPTGSDRLESPVFNLEFNVTAYEGHSSMLGHYFRHLYMMVKFVAESKIVTNYPEKMRYLKILRAQLSNYEQIILFYNWIGPYGAPWENENRQYFTEYCMIHNLWYNELIKNDFIKDKINQLIKRPVKFRKGPLFEADDNV